MSKAFAVYLEHGYSDASVSMLQEKMHIGRATMYYYFQSKEELFIETVRHFVIEEWDNTMKRIAEKALPLRELLEWVVESFRRVRMRIEECSPSSDMSNLGALLQHAYANDRRLREYIWNHRGEMASFVRAAIIRGVESGELRNDLDVDKMVMLFTDVRESREAGVHVKRSVDEEVSSYRELLLFLYGLIKSDRQAAGETGCVNGDVNNR